MFLMCSMGEDFPAPADLRSSSSPPEGEGMSGRGIKAYVVGFSSENGKCQVIGVFVNNACFAEIGNI